MDHDMRCVDGSTDVQRLLHPARDDAAQFGIVRGDGEAPERAVDAPAALVAVKQAVHLGGKAGPVAVQNLRLDEMLQFQIARRFAQPVHVLFKTRAAKGCAKDRAGGHRRASCVADTRMLPPADDRTIRLR